MWFGIDGDADVDVAFVGEAGDDDAYISERNNEESSCVEKRTPCVRSCSKAVDSAGSVASSIGKLEDVYSHPVALYSNVM